MFDYLQQFNKLPQSLRNQVSSPDIMHNINELEEKYGVDLAALVMQVMIKKIPADGLMLHFISEFRLTKDVATKLSQELLEKVFFRVQDYLGIKVEQKVEPAQPQEDQRTKNEAVPVIQKMVQDVVAKKEVEKAPEKKEEESKESRHERRAKKKAEEAKTAKDLGVNLLPGQEELSPDEKSQAEKKIPVEIPYDNFSIRINNYIDQVIKELNISFSSEQLSSRFRTILRTFMRGIRTKVDTRETLAKSVAKGGMNFENKLIDRILASLEKAIQAKVLVEQVEAPKPHQGVVDKITRLTSAPVKKEGPARTEADYNLAESIAKRQEKSAHEPERLAPPPPVIIEKKEEPAKAKVEAPKIDQKLVVPPRLRMNPPKPEPKLDQETKKKAMPEVHIDPKEIAKEIDLLQSQVKEDKVDLGVIAKQKQAAAAKLAAEKKGEGAESKKAEPMKARVNPTLGKQKLEDIRKPRIMGPVDELKYLDVVNFRRLAKDPKEAIQKLDQKIKLLEKNGYGKMLEAITAWRQSPINRLYAQMSMEAIIDGVKIEDIVARRQKHKQPYLKNEELEAILELNNNLMFQ